MKGALATQFAQAFRGALLKYHVLKSYQALASVTSPLYVCSLQARDLCVSQRKLAEYICAFTRVTSFRPQHGDTEKLYYTEEHFMIGKRFCSAVWAVKLGK